MGATANLTGEEFSLTLPAKGRRTPCVTECVHMLSNSSSKELMALCSPISPGKAQC